MAATSISEPKRVRYLLGLASAAEREHIESEYFEDEGAFQEMLTAEDDLIDSYARGELTDEERRRFEKSFLSSLHGRDRVQFARAFVSAVSATRSVETKLSGTLLDIFNTFQSPSLLRLATIAVVIVFVAVLAWLAIDRRIMTNELRELRAESAELSKRTEALQRSNDTERTRTAAISAQLADLQAQPKPRHPKRGTTRDGYVAGARADQSDITLNGVSVEPLNTQRLVPRNTSRGGGTVHGTVKDSNGKVVSGATVTLTASTVRDVQLELGTVSETVNITSAAEATTNTSDAGLGNSFEAKRITELPLDANNIALLSLQPGGNRGFIKGGRADQSNVTLDGVDAAIRITRFPNWIRFQIPIDTAAIHEDYRVTIQTPDGRPVTSVNWTEPLTPNQTIIDTPVISTDDLPSGHYVLLLMGKEPDGSFVKVAEYSFKVIEY